jgi:hypothetical protein
MKHWDDCQELPYIKGVTPVHAASGDALECRRLPFTGNTSRRWAAGCACVDVKEEAVTESHILALVDAWPPALMPFLKKPAPGSTLTWTIEFVQPLLELSTLDWCKYHETEHAADGYGHAAANLWSAGRVDCHEPADRDGVRLINDGGGAPARRATSRR